MLTKLLSIAATGLLLAVPVPALAVDAPYDVLVFGKTAGFRHDSIAAGIQAVRDLGAANSFTVTATEDATLFTAGNLAQYEAVVFLNTTGDVLNDTQQAAFESYVNGGGGFVGIHSAADTEYAWSFYGNLVGAYFSSHPAVQQATVKVENRAHAATAGLPQTLTRTDEWYNYQTNPRATARVLATLDEASYTGGTMGADHPISWCKTVSGGRSFYTGGGHSISAFGEPAFRTHLLGGIRYAAGRTKADCRPEPGYSALYNGSTTGWSQAGPGSFANSDATLTSVGGMGLFWYSAQQYTSYSLKLDWKMLGDDNSGVFIGFPASSDPWSAVNNGYEIQIDATDSPDRTTGSVYGFKSADIAARDAALNPPGEWNTYELLVEGERLRVYLNGVLINDYTNTDPVRSLAGHVGIQNHGTGDDVSFRNIRIKEMGTPPPTSGPITGLASKCLDVASSGTADGTKIQLWTCNGTGAQNWSRQGQTWRALGKCLDVASSGTADGTKVQLWTCNGSGAQNWAPGANSSIVNPQSGKCLDVAGSGTADGTQIQIWTCNGGANQRWTTPGSGNPGTPPPTSEFEKVKLDGGLSMGEPMELAVLPDGKVMYINRGTTTGGAQVRLYNNQTGYSGTALQLQVDARHEDGGLGISLHPQFATNRWVFIFYSPKVTPLVNRVSRFTYNPTTLTLDAASEKVVIQWPTERDLCCHSAGSMSWDSNNNLYFATGDNTNSWESAGMSPIDERPERHAQYDAQRTAGNTNDLRGKINRIHPEADGTYTIPSGNLFAPGTAGTRPEVFIMGVRNPFRIWVDKQANNTLYWGEVGPDASATDAQRGPAAYDEFNRATGPGNYGWPYCGGPNVAYNDWDFATNSPRGWFPCGGATGPVNNSPRNTGLQQLPPTKTSQVWEQHGGSREWPQLDNPGGCGAPNHVEVYHFNPNLASDVKWPQYYDNKWLISEYCRNWIKEVQFDNGNPSTGAPNAIYDVLAGMNFVHPMDFEFGLDGAMYLLEYGSGWFSGAEDAGLYRIIHNAGGNKSPTAKISADRDNGLAPLAVAFSSAGSSDPEGSSLTYAWDFDGNGSTDSTASNPTYTYGANGSYTAKLTVADTAGRTGSATLPIVVGNRRATLSIGGLPNGGLFDWGNTVTASASGSDPEDGAIPCAAITLRAAIGHEEHAHEVGTGSGCGATFHTGALQEPPDQRVFFIIRATYTDRGAAGSVPIAAETTIVLWPKRWQAEHVEQLNGPAVITAASAEGGKRIGAVNHNEWVRYHSVSLKNITGAVARVSSGGAGGRASLRLDSPTGPEVGFLNVSNTGSYDTYQELSATVSKPDDATHDLYLVFTNASAGTAALLDIDWLQFTGAGVGQGPRVGPLISAATNKCLDISGSGTADGTKIQIWTCNGTGAQQWTLGSDGTLRGLGKCLDVKSSGTTNGTLVQLWTCNGTAAQVWSIQTNGSLLNPQSGKCMDVAGNGTADGTQVQIWTCNGGANQRWTFP